MTAEPTLNPAIEARDISLYYGDFRAVKNISMTVEQNKVTAIIGPSGCGKSTLLRAFNRMNELMPGARLEGEIRFMGQNIYAPEVDPVRVRRQIGMVFQKPNPSPRASMTTLPGVRASTASRAASARPAWTIGWSTACAKPPCGTR